MAHPFPGRVLRRRVGRHPELWQVRAGTDGVPEIQGPHCIKPQGSFSETWVTWLQVETPQNNVTILGVSARMCNISSRISHVLYCRQQRIAGSKALKCALRGQAADLDARSP